MKSQGTTIILLILNHSTSAVTQYYKIIIFNQQLNVIPSLMLTLVALGWLGNKHGQQHMKMASSILPHAIHFLKRICEIKVHLYTVDLYLMIV